MICLGKKLKEGSWMQHSIRYHVIANPFGLNRNTRSYAANNYNTSIYRFSVYVLVRVWHHLTDWRYFNWILKHFTESSSKSIKLFSGLENFLEIYFDCLSRYKNVYLLLWKGIINRENPIKRTSQTYLWWVGFASTRKISGNRKIN